MKRKTRILTIITAVAVLVLPDKALTQETCGYIRGGVRLLGGRNSHEGRVEICNNGQWGQLCNTEFDSRDATVVCRQIGALSSSSTGNNVLAVAVNGSYYGQGQGPAWLNNLNCTGTESALLGCLTAEQQRSAWPSLSCTSFASVLCLETDEGQTVRLVGGRNEREGRVEVFYEGNWGPVCGGDNWGESEAQAVCRELGLYKNGSIGYSLYDQRVQNGLVSGIQCTGIENYLALCHGGTWQRQLCSQGPAAVACLPLDGCIEGTLRLRSSNTTREGRVEACHGGIWGGVCHNGGHQWTNADADLICRHLHFQDPDEIGARAVSTGQFGRGVGVVWSLNASGCGRENHTPCTPNDWVGTNCYHSTSAAIICPEPKQRLYLCVNIQAQSLYNYDTLYSFHSSVASRIASKIQATCTQPCSYSPRDISFESSWPSPIHPTTMCLPRDSILGLRITCKYRPRLNQNGLLQFIVTNVLHSLGSTIGCNSYSRYVITKDFNLGPCNGSRNVSVSLQQPQQPSTTSPTPGPHPTRVYINTVTVSRNKSMIHTPSSSLSVAPVSSASYINSTATPVLRRSSTNHVPNPSPPPVKVSPGDSGGQPSAPPEPPGPYVDQNHLNSSMTHAPSLTLVTSRIQSDPSSPSITPKIEKEEKMPRSWNHLLTVIIALLVVSVVLLFLCLFSIILSFRKLRKRKEQSCSSPNNLTTSAINPMQIHSSIPSPTITDNSTGYYEEVDGHNHEYAILEHMSLSDQRSPRSMATLSPSTLESESTNHGYFVLEHSNREELCTAITPPQTSARRGRGQGESVLPDEEGLYSCLVHGPLPNYATLSPHTQADKPRPDMPKYSCLETDKDPSLEHNYQVVFPDPGSDYDRTFAGSPTGPPLSVSVK